jgi:hypothetical protein
MEILTEFITALDSQYPGNIELFAGIAQVLASPLVLFLSDRAKGKLSIEDNQKWTLAMIGSLAFI